MPGYNELMSPPQVPQGQVPNFQQAGAYQQTLTPVQQPAPIQEGPPTSPQDLEQRKSGWMDFINKIQNDPAIRQSIIMGASQLMKGPGMGQTSAGALGQALQLGTTAHGFYQGNEQGRQQEEKRLTREQQQTNQQGRLTDSNIEQNTAQTNGLMQQQQFEREGQAYKLRKAASDAQTGEFAAGNQAISFEEELLNNKSKRDFENKRGNYMTNLGTRAVAASGPKTPAGVALLQERKALWKAGNPILGDEDPLDYDVRASASVYKDTQAGAGSNKGDKSIGAKINGLKYMLDSMDDKDPMRQEVQERLNRLTSDGEVADTTTSAASTGAWESARKSAPVGGKYTGPDGKTYTRKE